MFTVSGLTSEPEVDFYRGTGAPTFRTFTPNSLRTSLPAYRIRSNRIRYKFVITRQTDCAGFLWTNPTNIIQGSQEITINIDFEGGNATDVTCGDATVNSIEVNGKTVSTPLTQSANTWLETCTVARLIKNYSIINKVILGGITYEQFIGDSSPATLPERVFQFQKSSGTIRLQTPTETLYIGNQPIKIYGSAALGTALDIGVANPFVYNTILRNNGINQGIYELG